MHPFVEQVCKEIEMLDKRSKVCLGRCEMLLALKNNPKASVELNLETGEVTYGV